MQFTHFAGLLIVALAISGVARAEELRELCPDRPLKGTSACTVDKGHWQLETDIANWTHDRVGGITTDLIFAPNPTLKYGLTDDVDIEVSFSPFVTERVRGRGVSSHTSGIGDTILRAKWHVAGSNGEDGLAVEPFVKLPTAKRGLGNRSVEGGLIAPYQSHLPGGWDLDVTPEADLLRNSADNGYHLAISGSVGISHALTTSWAFGADVYTQANFEPMHTERQSTFDVALVWQPKRAEFAVDFGVGFGLTRTAPGIEYSVGFSRRF